MQSDYNMWRVFHIIICITSLFGWYAAVNTTESNLNYTSLDNFEEETIDQSKNDQDENIMEWLIRFLCTMILELYLITFKK